MTTKNHNGFFIVFEGGEGSTKSTQIKLLSDNLKEHGFMRVLTTHEPGGYGLEFGKKIRSLLLDESENLDVYTKLFLFCAGRAEHIIKVVKPALNDEHAIVLCDRFSGATFAYEYFGYGMTESFDIIWEVERIARRDIYPDITFFLDVPPEIGLAKVKERGEKLTTFEKEKIDFHQRVYEGYKQLATSEANWITIKCVDANGQLLDQHIIANEILNIAISKIKNIER
ncbi:MAG: dTMP kinase [Parcubacteria group bacterium]|nr:dTMP kinase [Parcubacteria group bacterium]